MELISVKKFVALIRMDMPDLKSMCNICWSKQKAPKNVLLKQSNRFTKTQLPF